MSTYVVILLVVLAVVLYVWYAQSNVATMHEFTGDTAKVRGEDQGD